MEQADPPHVTPALDIIQSIYKCIGRKERREQNLADTWSAFETNVFLGSFFYWWTDDGGASIVTALVTDGGTALAKHEEPAQQFG